MIVRICWINGLKLSALGKKVFTSIWTGCFNQLCSSIPHNTSHLYVCNEHFQSHEIEKKIAYRCGHWAIAHYHFTPTNPKCLGSKGWRIGDQAGLSSSLRWIFFSILHSLAMGDWHFHCFLVGSFSLDSGKALCYEPVIMGMACSSSPSWKGSNPQCSLCAGWQRAKLSRLRIK